MYTYLIYTYIHTYMQTYKHTCIKDTSAVNKIKIVNTHISIYMIYNRQNTYKCIYIYIHIHICIYMCVYICICIYMCIHIYTFI